MRDPASSFIQSGYHDVPWEEPELVRACIQKALKQGSRKMRQNVEQSIADKRTANLPRLIKSELNESRHEQRTPYLSSQSSGASFSGHLAPHRSAHTRPHRDV